MASKLTDSERSKIVGLLREGNSQGAVAKETGRGKATISRVASASGMDLERSRTEKATKAHSLFAEIDRKEVVAEMLQKGQDILKDLKDAREYKDVVTGLGISIDKHLLISGEATARSESKHQHRTLDLSQATSEELDEFERIVGGS